MIRPRRVFLSSVFKSLESVRRTICNHLCDLGYEVWWAEDHPELRNASPEIVKAVCLQGIETCDIYLGIFPARYGSDPLGMAFTELEYHHAVALGLPRFLYVLYDRRFTTDDQRIKQQGFIHLLRDRDISVVQPTRVASIPKLLNKVNADFEALRVTSMLGPVNPWEAPSIKKMSAQTTLITSRLPPLNIEDASIFLKDVAKHSLAEAAVVGLSYASRFLVSPNWRDQPFIEHLDSFLETWTYVAAWAGVKGPFGQTSISKARVVLSQMKNDYSKVYDLAGAVASGFYSDRRLTAARKWYEFGRRMHSLPWLIGAIELAEGDVGSAKSHFLEIIIRPSLAPDNYALHLGYYGLCLVKLGDVKDGMRHLIEAVSIPSLSPTTLTRIHRSAAEAYIHVGDSVSALAMCDKAASIASSSELKGQLRKALKIKRKILSNMLLNPTGVPLRSTPAG